MEWLVKKLNNNLINFLIKLRKKVNSYLIKIRLEETKEWLAVLLGKE